MTRELSFLVLKEMSGWARRTERSGRTPTIDEQANWLSKRSGVRVPGGAIGAGLDRLLLKAGILAAPGARRALRLLRDAGVPVGVVSNVLHQTSDGAREVLERTRIAEFFRSVTLSSDIPWAKPRPEPFLRCLADLGVEPAGAAHIGDLSLDVEGARRAGMQPLLYTGLHRCEPARDRPLFNRIDGRVRRVRSWSELPGFFDPRSSRR
ncbi:MAG: HAD family hydrolase [Candidatus Lutacidiplasmatales archaeon]